MIHGTAVISKCEAYRYLLGRYLGCNKGTCLFIMLNPSTADAKEDDKTVLKCKRFATSWGFGQLAIVNLFAYRTKDPEILKTSLDKDGNKIDPIGPDNNYWILKLANDCQRVVCAWGNNGVFKNRSKEVCLMLKENGVPLYSLHINQNGEPGHPLYLTYDTNPIEFVKTKP